jgi:hypothetical protein
MKGSVEQAFAAGELIVRTGRYLVVLTLPLVCWLAGQECPGQMLLAWAVQRGMALLTTAKSSAQAKDTVPSPFLGVGPQISARAVRHTQVCEPESCEGLANTIV